MSKGLLFWILMILWFLSAIGPYLGFTYPVISIGGSVLLFILLMILGWAQFGPPVR